MCDKGIECDGQHGKGLHVTDSMKRGLRVTQGPSVITGLCVIKGLSVTDSVTKGCM